MTTLAVSDVSSSRIGRSLVAVIAGLLLNVVLSTATDVVLALAGVFPPLSQYGEASLFSHSMLALAFMYRTLFGVLGCYVTARLAPQRPLLHAMILGAVGFVIGVAGAIVMWDASQAWYALGIIAVTLPSAWLGGTLAQRQARGEG
jgi:hypothetical protein